MASLLAVDLGVRCGLALYGDDGRLRWYRSRNFGSAARLKRGIPTILDGIEDLTAVVLEGGGDLFVAWRREADRRGLRVERVDAEGWRPRLLLPREQRDGRSAKRHADEAARRVIDWSDAARPRALRHDAAEAILVGLWGVLTVGWLAALPPVLRP